MATPPILSSLIAGNNSNGKESSTQYFVMIGATFVSMNVRTCFTDCQLIGGAMFLRVGRSQNSAEEVFFLISFVGLAMKFPFVPFALCL